MSDPKRYTANDIERYHRGDMTPAEMHQLEKAALHDPMLADALEGYRYSRSASSEMAGLQARLQQRIGENKQSNRAIWMQPWMRIAALFVLIAGGGWLVFQTLGSSNNELATSSPDTAKTVAQDKIATTDSTPPVLQQPSAFSIDSTGGTDVTMIKKQGSQRLPEQKPEVSAAPVTGMNEPTADAVKIPEEEAAQPRETADAAAARITTMKAEAPQAARRQRSDSVANSPSMLKRKMATETDRNGILTTTENSASRFAIDSSATPEGGWAAFENHILNNQKPSLPLNKRQTVPAAVELAFAIDKEGNPVAIVITKSGSKERDEEAIRLLKEGPKWKGKKGKVRIPFQE